MYFSDMLRYLILPFVLFIALMVGLTALLQYSLFIYKLAGSYAHWAAILLVLPILLGMLLRLLETESPLMVVVTGALSSTVILYYLYEHYFWAQAPTLLNGLFLFAVVAGCAHLPYSRGPVERFLFRIQAIIKSRKKRSRSKGKGRTAGSRKSPTVLQSIFTKENTISLIEMSVGIASLLLSVYSITFMGQG